MKKMFPLLLFVALSVTCYAQTASFLLTTAPCHNDGVLEVTFAGLTPPLTVTWTTYGTSGTAIIHTSVSGLTDDLTGYSGGEVSVSATDGSGDIDTGYYSGHPPFTICPLSDSMAICPALDTLFASVCSGGTSPFTYQWYNASTYSIVGTGSTIYEKPGVYGVNVTDAAGCTFGSLVSSIIVDAPAAAPAYADSIIATIANCTDGAATVIPYGGGTPPYSYRWSNGATSATINGLVMGTYGVSITDAAGCQVTDNAVILQSVTVTATVVTTAAACTADGGIAVYSSGGTPPYTYAWNNGVTASSQTGLAGGSYSVSIKDANGCIGFGGGIVGASTPITVTYSATPSLCIAPTGNATLGITGGTGPYSITWYTTPAQTGITAHTLTYGNYSFEVTDDAGCTQSGTVYVPPIDTISVSFLSAPALCTLSNGSLTAYPTGGVAPYFYSWSTGAATQGITSAPAGSYVVTVTDHVGCTVTREAYLSGTSPLGVGITSSPSSCIYANDGSETATAWGGTPPYSYAWSSGGTTSVISALPYGPYWLTVTDAAGCTSPGNYSSVAYNPEATDCYCTISGTVYNDLNANCFQESGEPGIPNIQVHIGNMGYTYTDESGHYSMKVPSGSYTVSETNLGYYSLSGCQLNGIPVSVSASAGCTHNVNFSNRGGAVHDMHISTWANSSARPVPGQQYSQVAIVSNDGTVPEDSILVHYRPDGRIFAPYFAPGGVFSGTSLQYSSGTSFPMLTPGTAQAFFMTYNVPENMPLGTSIVFMDTVSYKSPIDLWLMDNTPWNNINSVTTTTAASAGSVNFIEVNPVGTGAAGIIPYTDSVLEYMIHFQSGLPSVENVVIIDTLDANLDWTSLRPVFESAQCYVMLFQSGSKNVAQFTFSGIDFPAESGSNGMLTYTIKLNSGLPLGTQIRNRASIYYDDNPPAVTNTTLNTLGSVAPSGITKLSSQNQNPFTIYPNPANGSFSALLNNDAVGSAVMVISDITGKTLLSKNISLQTGTQTVSTDVSQFAPGVYFVSLVGNGKTQTQKLVILN